MSRFLFETGEVDAFTEEFATCSKIQHFNLKDTNQALFDELLMSESESEVIKVLKKYKYWDISKGLTDWKYFGDNESNYSTVTGQTTDIYGALVEKLMNSEHQI